MDHLCQWTAKRRTMVCNRCDELLAAYKREARSQALRECCAENFRRSGDDSRLATHEAAHLQLKCREARDALMAHFRHDHSSRNEDLGPS